MAKASPKKKPRFATLTDHQSGKSVDLPVYSGTLGPDVIDVRGVYKETGMFTFDPGFASTASCESQITYIDGDKGILLHRGYAIEELASKSSFLEVAYLLLYGDLANKKQQADFDFDITHHTMVHEQVKSFMNGFRRDAHPMAMMVSLVGALSSFYHNEMDLSCAATRQRVTHSLIAKVPTLAAMTYKYAVGQPFVYPQNDLTFAENFLHMMFAVPSEDYEISPVLADATDKIMILHADHEQNASTSTVRLAGSTGADPYACVAAGIASLWGPAHGGANEAVLKMLAEIGDTKNIKHFIKRSKDKDDPFRLMGFGHRVYKNYDPRAKVLRQACHDVLDELDMRNHPLFELAMELERIALEDDYFVQKKLFPNVDFYSGIILQAMNIPTSMFTVLFAMARTVGWVAQWKEMYEDPMFRIGRPRQLFTGAKPRKYVPMNKR